MAVIPLPIITFSNFSHIKNANCPRLSTPLGITTVCKLGQFKNASSSMVETPSGISTDMIFSLLAKLVVLIVGLFGTAPIWLAVLADTGVTLLTVLNALRILRK